VKKRLLMIATSTALLFTLFVLSPQMNIDVSAKRPNKRVTKLNPVEEVTNQYVYDYGYEKGRTIVMYDAVMDNFKAELKANQLKPFFTYQVKLVGKPTCAGGNDETNELIGYAGRWYCPGCGGSVAGQNRTDAQYEANLASGEPDCIFGYLVFDFFTTDYKGSINTTIEADGSYHVLWCESGNQDLYNLDISARPFTEYEIKCDTPKLCAEENVIPQKEKSLSELPEGNYKDLTIALTEESFHQNCGSWATVLENDIEFIIEK